MRSFARFSPVFVAVVAVMAWGAAALFNGQTRAWAEQDLSKRTRLALERARSTLAEADRMSAQLETIARDDGLMAAALCLRDGTAVVTTVGCRPEYAYAKLPEAAKVNGDGWDRAASDATGTVHFTTAWATALAGSPDVQ